MWRSVGRTQSWLGRESSFTRSYSLPLEASRLNEFHSTSRWKAYFNASKESPQLMVIYFTATWCGPCRYMEPSISEMVSKFTDVQFVKLDVDELLEVSQEFRVQVMPTFILIKQGKEVDKVLGVKKDELHNKILKHRGLQLQYA